jgi:hypothetical protein
MDFIIQEAPFLKKIFLKFFDLKKGNIATQLVNVAPIYCITVAHGCS